MILHLLDTERSHPVQTWDFNGSQRITIGRAGGNDVRLTHPQVSRLHVELVHRDGQWVCVSHGRNGTLIDGESVTQWPLCDGSILQLGLHGPEFQVVMESRVDSTLQTVDCTDRSALDFLVIDEQRKAEEVEQISATEAFRDLREKARRLKHGDGNDAGASKSSTHELAGIEHGPRLGGE